MLANGSPWKKGPCKEGTFHRYANIALHGLETIMNKGFHGVGARLSSTKIVVYADDFVILTRTPDRHAMPGDGYRVAARDGTPTETQQDAYHPYPRSNRGTPDSTSSAFTSDNTRQNKTILGKDCRGRLHGFKTLIKPSQTAIRRHVDQSA